MPVVDSAGSAPSRNAEKIAGARAWWRSRHAEMSKRSCGDIVRSLPPLDEDRAATYARILRMLSFEDQPQSVSFRERSWSTRKNQPMATADLVDFFKSIPDILNVIPANQRLVALTLLTLLIALLGLFHFNILKLVGEKARARAIFMIIRYGFVGVIVIFFMTFGYNLITFKSEASSLNQSITNLGQSTQLSSSGKLNPILPQDQIQKLAESLVLLSRSFDAPAGIADALTQLQAGNIAPAVDILQKNAQSQTDAGKQAEAWRQVGLLAFYKDTQVALQAYQQSVKLDPDHWQAWSQIAYLLERTGDHDGAKAAAQKAIDIGTRQNDKKALAAGDAALGYIAASAGNLSSAGDYLEKARDNLRGPDSLAGYARATSSLARVKYAGADYDAARSLYEEALKSDTAADSPGGMAADYTGLAQLLVELSDPDEADGLKALDQATDYLNKALAIGQNLNDKHQQAMALSKMADIDGMKNNLDGAEKDCIDALNLENELGYKLPAVYLVVGLDHYRLSHRQIGRHCSQKTQRS
jgi:tetratricopeptide (TPR) repeat protein